MSIHTFFFPSSSLFRFAQEVKSWPWVFLYHSLLEPSINRNFFFCICGKDEQDIKSETILEGALQQWHRVSHPHRKSFSVTQYDIDEANIDAPVRRNFWRICLRENYSKKLTLRKTSSNKKGRNISSWGNVAGMPRCFCVIGPERRIGAQKFRSAFESANSSRAVSFMARNRELFEPFTGFHRISCIS